MSKKHIRIAYAEWRIIDAYHRERIIVLYPETVL